MSNISPSYILHRDAPITDLNFWESNLSPESRWHLIACYTGKCGVDVIDLVSWRPKFSLPCNEPGGMLSACGVNDAELVTLSKDGQLKLIDLCSSSARPKVNLSLGNVAFCKASVFNQASTLTVAVPGEEKSSVNVWDLNNSKIVSRLIPKPTQSLGMPMCLKLSTTSRLLATVGYEDGSVFIWDVMESRTVFEASQIFPEPVMCLDVCVDEDKDSFVAVSGSATNDLIRQSVHLPSIKTLTDEKTDMTSKLMKQSLLNPGVAAVKIRADKKIIAMGGWDYKIRIYGFKKLKPLACLQYHAGTVQAMAFCHHFDSSKQILACGSTDQKITVWNIYND